MLWVPGGMVLIHHLRALPTDVVRAQYNESELTTGGTGRIGRSLLESVKHGAKNIILDVSSGSCGAAACTLVENITCFHRKVTLGIRVCDVGNREQLMGLIGGIQ